MTTTYKLTYDPSDAKRGFELLAQAIKLAQQAGASLPPELQQIASRLDQVETGAADTAADLNKLDNELDDVSMSAKQADERLGSFAVSTQQVGTAATATAAKVNQQASAIEKTGKVVGSTREGLEKLTGAASALGNESAEVTKGMGVLAGVVAAVASPIGAAVTVVASLVSILKSLNDGATSLADPGNPIDAAVLGIGRAFGLLSEEAARAYETLKNDTATERFAENFKRGEEAAIAFGNAVLGVGKAIDAGRQSREDDSWVNIIGDPEAISTEIDRLRSSMEELAQSRNLSEAQFGQMKELINKLEARRNVLLDEQKRKEDEAYESRWVRAKGTIDQEDTRHQQRMDNLDEEKKAEEEVADIRQRGNDDVTKAVIARVLEEMKGIKQVGQEQQKQFDEQQQRQEQAKNPYGEGQAVEGSGSNPYAAAVDPLATALGSGFGESVGGSAATENGGGGGPSRRKQINDLSKQIYQEGFKELGFENDQQYFDSQDYDARDRRRNRARIQKDSRKMAVDALDDGRIDDSDPELVTRAQERLLEKQTEEAARRLGADKKQIDLLQDIVKVIERQSADGARNEQTINTLSNLVTQILGGRQNFRPGRPRQ
ncbi:hypothetical protein K2X85_19820 [bacterium]|nr:hypothetical protein [bacterium]